MKKDYMIWVLKGAAMGAADAVPGVSGGTMALITGVYERFINALASFRPSLFGYLQRRDLKGLWQAVDGTFLLCLGSGILISLFSVLNLMHWLLESYAPVVWGFFMGVILASLYYLMIGRKWLSKDIVLLLIGLAIALILVTASGTVVAATPVTLMLGGALAISAMLLPGISGSFMLLLLGLYPVVVEAVHDRDLMIVLWVAIGCLIGILSVSRVLQWSLARWHDRVISCMLGFVVGALVKVWPWQHEGNWYLPAQFVQESGEAAWLGLSVVSLMVGGILVAILHIRTENG